VAALGPVVARFFAGRSRARRRASGSALPPDDPFISTARAASGSPRENSAARRRRPRRWPSRGSRGMTIEGARGRDFCRAPEQGESHVHLHLRRRRHRLYIAGHFAGARGRDVGVVRVMTLKRDRARPGRAAMAGPRRACRRLRLGRREGDQARRHSPARQGRGLPHRRARRYPLGPCDGAGVGHEGGRYARARARHHSR
jgi:hypothetical protein